MTLNPTEIFLYGVGLTLVGAAIGWYVVHRLTDSRERRTRRGAFVGYLLQWRTNIERCAPNDAKSTWTAYLAGVSGFRLEFGKIREDYLKDAVFLSTANGLGSIQSGDIDRAKPDAREPPCMLIDTLVALTK